MDRPQLPLNALRAFEVSARHLSFTRAGLELCVSQAAVSHQIKALEARLGVTLFRRLPRGLALTDEGAALVPVLKDAFDRMGATLDRFVDGRFQEVLTVGVVGAFASGWLLPRLDRFRLAHPGVDIRVLTNNNRVDLAGDGLDLAIRFGDGAWHGVEAAPIMAAPLSPACSPALAETLRSPEDLIGQTLLRSYRGLEWPAWFAAAGLACPRLRGPLFDNSVVMAAAATQGLGVALLPVALFASEIAAERLVRPFPIEIDVGRYWLTRLRSRPETPAMSAFHLWLSDQIAQEADPTAERS
jgi:LysR family transcriptional regulator of beta-lactamase